MAEQGAAIHNPPAPSDGVILMIREACAGLLNAYRCLIACSLLLLGFPPSAAADSGQDTITVDGVPLILELDVTEMAGFEQPKGRVKSRSLFGKPDLLLGATAGVTRHQENAQGMRLSGYLNKGFRPTMGITSALEWKSGPGIVRLEAGLDLHEDWAYDSAALDDSLFGLAPDGNGGLEQWVYRTYDIGIELDTLPVPVALVREQAIRIGLSFGGDWEMGRRAAVGTWRWWTGFHGRWSRSGRLSGQVNRISSTMLPSPAGVEGAERNDWEKLKAWVWGWTGGVAFPLGPKGWSGLVCGRYAAGDRGHWAFNVGLQYRWGTRRR